MAAPVVPRTVFSMIAVPMLSLTRMPLPPPLTRLARSTLLAVPSSSSPSRMPAELSVSWLSSIVCRAPPRVMIPAPPDVAISLPATRVLTAYSSRTPSPLLAPIALPVISALRVPAWTATPMLVADEGVVADDAADLALVGVGEVDARPPG